MAKNKQILYKDILTYKFNETNKIYKNVSTKKYKLEKDVNDNENIINVYNENKLMLSSKYEVLGNYDKSTNVFIWGNCIKPIKSQTHCVSIIRNAKENIKNYIINKKFDDVNFMEKILYYLENDVMLILNENIIDLIKICVFESQGMVVYQENNTQNKNTCTYYLLTEIMSYA